MSRNRTWFDWHSWLGVTGGLLLFVVCWTGTFATISAELDWLANPDIRVTPREERTDFSAVYEATRAAYPDGPMPKFIAPVYSGFAVKSIVKTETGQIRSVYVDPYKATVTGSTSYFDIWRFFRSIHMNLFDPFRLGSYVVGVCGIILLLSLMTALFFYRRWWRRFFEFKAGREQRSFWSAAHKFAGLWSLWFLLSVGVTGTWYLIGDIRLFHGDGKVRWAGPADFAIRAIPPHEAAGPALPFEALVDIARRVRPDLAIRSIDPNRLGYFYVEGQSDYFLVAHDANALYLNPETGAVTYDLQASDLPAYWRWEETIDPLHFGYFGGLTTKLIWFVFGVILSGLCLSGTWLHVKRLQRDVRGRAGRRGTLTAVATTYVILGAVVVSGIGEIKGYGPVIDGVRRWPDVPVGVIAFIGGWVVVTVAILGLWTTWLLRATHAARAH